jgi:hypothetical protein
MEMEMWMEEVMDNPVAKRFIEIAGKDRLAEEARRALGRVLARRAAKLNLDPPDDAETLLATYADANVLSEMIEDMTNMTDFREFLKDDSVEIPGLTS